MREKIARITDVNCNRTREGLRVLEEVSRFWLDDETLFRTLKELRHGFCSVENELRSHLPETGPSRDSEHDVGQELIPTLESNRTDILSIVEANARRVQEALRVLEEFLKLMEPQAVEKIKAIRFQTYTIEKELKNALII